MSTIDRFFVMAAGAGLFAATLIPACGSSEGGSGGSGGGMPLGGYCEADADCASGNCGPNAMCGPLLIPAGSPCTTSAACASGNCASGICGCEYDTDCASMVCSEIVPACGPFPDGSPCARDIECTAEVCAGGTCGPKPDGTPCTSDADCTSGVCAGDEYQMTCGASPNDHPCAGDQDCTSGVCYKGVCGEGPGGPCSTDGDCQSAYILCTSDSDCGPDTACDGGVCAGSLNCNAGTCQFPQPNGKPCTSAEQCSSRMCVDGSCGPQPVGSACTMDSDCAQGWCNAGTCQAPNPPGSPCTANDECTTTFCDDGTCQEYRANGAACATDVECTSGTCTGGICTCVGPATETTSPAACCGGGTEYTDCEDPESNACPCTGQLDGHYACNSSVGLACTTVAACDPGLACGGTGACCGLPGAFVPGNPLMPYPPGSSCCSGVFTNNTVGCACSTSGAACQTAAECCSATCNGNGTCA